MAPPNSLYLPVIARQHAQALFLQRMVLLSSASELVDFIPDSSRGGDFFHLPQHGRITGLARADVKGTLTTDQTPQELDHKDQIGVVLHRTALVEWFHVTPEIAGLSNEAFSAEVGNQIANWAALQVIADMYAVGLAAAAGVSDDHDHDVYVDDVDATDQVDLLASVVLAAKFLMGDLSPSMKLGFVHSKQWNDLSNDSLTNSTNQVWNVLGDTYRNGQFASILGTTFAQDDNAPVAAGATTLSPSKYQGLIMRPRSEHPQRLAPFVISFQSELEIYEQHVLGDQAVKFQRQPHLSYGIGVRGMAYDETNGGPNPTDAALTTTSNWDDAYNDHKEVGIVSVRTN